MTSINWTKDLIKQVSRRNVVLFVGAGVSMGSKNGAMVGPVGWAELLNNLAAEICTDAQVLTDVTPRLATGDYLLAGEFIKYIASKTGNLNHYRETIVTLCDGPEDDKFLPSELHNALIDLDPPVIVTTNFDAILERATGEGYMAVSYNEPDIDNVVRQGKNIILKLHGSVKNNFPMVLTQSEYTRLRKDGELALDVLQSLLLTKMALFVGYSFNDPDLKLILETLYGVPGRGPGHVLVLNGEIPDFQQELFTGVYGLNVLTYPQGQHQVLLDGIRELALSIGP